METNQGRKLDLILTIFNGAQLQGSTIRLDQLLEFFFVFLENTIEKHENTFQESLFDLPHEGGCLEGFTRHVEGQILRYNRQDPKGCENNERMPYHQLLPSPSWPISAAHPHQGQML
jgi:hypothetical protein